MMLKDFKNESDYIDYLCTVEDYDEDAARDQAYAEKYNLNEKWSEYK